MKILILASNPRKDLNLDREIRDLRDVVEKSRNRQQLEVEDALAVRVGDLQDLLFKHEPHIVHFCGHGGGQPGLVFEGNDGGEQWVRTGALHDLFRLFSSKVGCVLLNACYSEEQANEIVNHIDYVIGMNQEIRDDAAIAFSKGFYRALGYDCSIEEAYEFGCNAIQLEITGSSTVRSAATSLRKAEVVNAVATTIIPEYLKPILKKREGASSRNRWKTETSQPLSQGKKEELQLELAHELVGDRSAQVASNQSRFPPSNSLVSQPIQTAPNVSRSPRSRLTRLFLGGLITCLITAGGIYGYGQWQASQLQQNPLQQAIELENQGQLEAAIATLNQLPANSPLAAQSGGYLESWSTRLLQRAEEYYEKGDIDEAVRLANAIPVKSPVHPRAQTAIKDWDKDKQILEDIKKRLATNWDVPGGRRLLEGIKSPGLRKQGEDSIAEIEKKIPSASPSPLPPPISQPNPPPEKVPEKAPSSSWSSYKYAWLSSREVTQADLEGNPASELSIMRNSIYAKYGRIFTSPELRTYFSQYSWYEAKSKNVDDSLTPIEDRNVTEIKTFQTKMGYQ